MVSSAPALVADGMGSVDMFASPVSQSWHQMSRKTRICDFSGAGAPIEKSMRMDVETMIDRWLIQGRDARSLLRMRACSRQSTS